MNNQALKAGEIFREAGSAFHKLSEMTMMLHPMADTQSGGKWTDEEIEMLRLCVHRFAVDLTKLGNHMKTRNSKSRTLLKKKSFEEAGIPARQVSRIVPRVGKPATQLIQGVLRNNAEVTLNMLNATENEVDVEGLTGEVKLEFDGSSEEVSV